VAFTALVAGDGPDLADLRGFVDRNNLATRVRLLGALSSDRIRELLAASDVFFLPSQWEGIALSVYEAMACGVPVGGAAVGGQAELVRPECGVLIDRGDGDAGEVDRYTAALTELLTNPARRNEMGAAARARVQDGFQLDVMTEQMVRLFDQGRQLHVESPRARPSIGVGRACAFQVLEMMRLEEMADEMWARRDQGAVRVRAYSGFARVFEPLYHWGLKRGWKWLPPLRAKLRLAVMGRP
jgi:hypothetical protein